jgi:hypothetical protein
MGAREGLRLIATLIGGGFLVYAAQHPAQVQSGKFVGVWRRSGGEWRLLVNISNSDSPAGPPAAA